MIARYVWIGLTAWAWTACTAGAQPAAPVEPGKEATPSVKPERATAQPVSGVRIVLEAPEQEGAYRATRVLVLLAKVEGRTKEPRASLNDWFNPPQIFGADWKPTDGAMELSAAWSGFPKALSELSAGDYLLQVVVKRNLDRCHTGGNDGDVFSEPTAIHWDPQSQAKQTVSVKQIHQEPAFPDAPRLKVFEARSALLSDFAGHEVRQRASVFVPKDFAKSPEKQYPVVVAIGGFGSTHYDIGGLAKSFPADFLAQVLLVVPDPSSYYGHCVFADSANNGPRGKALVEELLPAIEKEYRGLGPAHRYVTGISSGGWSALWLQVSYPDQFNGCWSFCPDPVDFRDFQRIDLTAADANMYKDGDGARRPLARSGDAPTLWYDDFVRMETAVGPGGQIGAFEAVFSPRGSDGKPVPLFDRATGKVDPVVAKAWQKYDIRRLIESQWGELSKKLPQKLHIYAGGKDTFYLEGAAKLLQASLKDLASDAEVEIIPGMIHTIYRPGVTRMARVVSEREALAIKPREGTPAPSPAKPEPAAQPGR